MKGDFIWDDWALITNNDIIKSWDNLPQILTSHPFKESEGGQGVDPEAVRYYRPLITISYVFDYSMWELNPLGYHITNLIWHIANGIIIYFLTCLLFKDVKLALITSLLFATHPIHTESVSWISGRTDVIASFFFFACLYCYVLMYSYKNPQKLFLFSISLLFFLFGLYSKEMVATLPFILIIVDYFRCQRFQDLRGRIKFWLAYWGILLIHLSVRLINPNLGIGAHSLIESMNKLYVLFNFGRALVYYLKKLFLPFDLSTYVIIEVIKKGLPFDVIIMLALFVGSLIFVYFKRKTDIAFSILFFWLSLTPIMNLIPISAPAGMEFPVAERFLYIPSFAFCLLVATLLIRLNEVNGAKHISLGIIGSIVLVLFYTGGTIFANTRWKDGVSFFKSELKYNPDSYLLYNGLGYTHRLNDDCDNAIPYFNKALQFKADDKIAHLNLAYCYFLKGDYHKAIAENRAALKLDNSLIEAHLSLGVCYWQIGDVDRSIDEMLIAYKMNPKYHRTNRAFKTLLKNLEKTKQLHKLKDKLSKLDSIQPQ